jgi:tetratricopeptide (TPR) repeat protein
VNETSLHLSPTRRALYADGKGIVRGALGLEATELDLPRGIAYAKEVLGLSAYAQGKLEEAKEQLQKAVASFRKVDDRRNVAYALANLVRTVYRQDDHVGATNFLDESLSTPILFRTP